MTENQSFPRIDITFAPCWWHEQYGMDFSESYWLDPVARAERSMEQKKLLYGRFGDVGLGEKEPAPKAGIDAYGDRFMAALWGCQITYQADQAPAAIVLPDAREKMENLRMPDIYESPVVKRAFAEASVLKERYGNCDGSINFGGPLNNAVSVFGEDILAACVAEPRLARDVLQIMAETILTVHDNVTCRINGVEVSEGRESGGIGNCPVCMISPETYREVILPVDGWLRKQFRSFFLHHCGVFHPYAEAYKPLMPDLLDIGGGTDLCAARKTYPETEMSLEIRASHLIGNSREEIDRMVAKMVRDARPSELIAYMWVADAGPELTDETVRNLMTCHERIKI